MIRSHEKSHGKKIKEKMEVSKMRFPLSGIFPPVVTLYMWYAWNEVKNASEINGHSDYSIYNFCEHELIKRKAIGS